MLRTTLTLAAAGLLGLGLSACGGDDGGDSSTSSTTTTIGKDDFIAQANEICTASSKELQQAAAESFKTGKQPSDEELGAFITDSFIPTVQDRIDDIRALGAPADLESRVGQFLDNSQKILDDLEDDPQSFDASTFQFVNAAAADLGMKACSN